MMKVFLPFLAGILVAEHFDLPLPFVAGVTAVCALAALLLRSSLYLLAMAAGCGMAVMQYHNNRAQPVSTGPAICRVVIGESFRHSATARLEGIYDPAAARWIPADKRIVLFTDSCLNLSPRERVTARLRLGRLRPANSFTRTLFRTGHRTCGRLRSADILERAPREHSLLHRRTLDRLSKLGSGRRQEAVLHAMLLGDRRLITPSQRDSYSRSGMAHLLAMSGLHTAIVFLLLNISLGWLALFRHGQTLRSVAAVALMWCYVVMAGTPPSAVRAAVMCSLLQFSLSRSSHYNGLNTLAATATLMLAADPSLIADPSFLLSFAAVGGLALRRRSGARVTRRRNLPLTALAETLSMGLVATIATAPLAACYFGRIPLWGILLNPVVIPSATLALLGSAVWILLPFEAAAPLVRLATDTTARLMNAAALHTSRLPASTLELSLSPREAVLLYLFFAVMTLAMWYRDRKKALPLHL